MRIGLLFLALISFLWIPSVQAVGQVPTPVRSVSSLPATCRGGSPFVPSDLVFLISGGIGTLKGCTATNTWTSIGAISGVGNPGLENCAPDQTGNNFYTVTALTNYFDAHWEFVTGQNSYINCQVYIPTASTGAIFVLDIESSDATAGHTANFQTCDGVINSGTIDTGALTCATNQVFTTTTTANNRVTLTFNVQSTLSDNSLLIVKIATSTTGTSASANYKVFPHFVL